MICQQWYFTVRGVACSIAALTIPAACPRAGADVPASPADVEILGAVAYDKTGYGLAYGDFNGDGSNDLAVLSEGQAGSSGSAFVDIFWDRLATVIDMAVPTISRSRVTAPPAEDGMWSRLEWGDYNGDGIDDIALGMPCPDSFLRCDGKMYIVYGAHNFPTHVDLTSPSIPTTTVFAVPGSVGFLGTMSATGDVNGDFIDDLVIAAPEFDGGRVYVLWGAPVMPPTIDLTSDDTRVTRLIDPRSLTHNSGTGLACGDANNDNFDDLLIGSTKGGEVMLVLGASSLPDTIVLTQPPTKHLYKDASRGPGWRVQLADFNGDGYDDMVMSTLLASPLGCRYCGDVMVVYGAQIIPDTVIVDALGTRATRMFGTGSVQEYGVELAHGDLNSDGYDDILISSSPDESDVTVVGKVTIVYGSATPPDSILLGTDSTVTRIHAESRPDGFGRGLLSRDIDNDGIDDILVGARWATAAGRTRAGKVYIFHGERESTSTDPNRRPTWRLGQNYPNPFNPSTYIPISLPGAEAVTLRIYDVHGRRVRTLINGPLDAGDHRVSWNGEDELGQPVASGVYFYRLTGVSYAAARKLVLLR